jgi:hypothetical protein
MRKKANVIFVTVMYPGQSSEIKTLLLIESIRVFAGSLSKNPIWCLILGSEKMLSNTTRDTMADLAVKPLSFAIDRTTAQFPFSSEIRAAAFAESQIGTTVDVLVWLLANTLVLREPAHFLLSDEKSVGYRPVHHTLVGSRYNEPLDPFWKLIYRECKVPQDHVFAMMTHVDKTLVRPYFNAGVLITRPQRKLFQQWHDTFFRIYQAPEFRKLYQQDQRYVIFMHQAVLSGVILSDFKTDELQELPRTYNYPLHLYAEDVSGNRPTTLQELVTIRYEKLTDDLSWLDKMKAGHDLKQWIVKRLK